MAMGIFSFAIIVIMGLLSSLGISSRDSWMQTRSAHLARQIEDDLVADPAFADTVTGQANSDMGLVMQMTNNIIQVPLQATAPTTNIVYYTTDGIATNSASAVFQAQIILQPISVEPAAAPILSRTVTQMEVDVRPAAQLNAVPYRYFSRITPQEADSD